MADPLRLQALAAVEINAATKCMLDGGSVEAWEREMRAILTRAHTAAWIAGTAERLGVKPDSPLISQRRLSKAERAEIKAIVGEQLQYLAGFAQARSSLSDAQIAARAAMYAGATRSTYYSARWGDWDIPPELMPGAQQCKANCRCRVSVRDSGDGTGVLTREMGGAEHHCTECPPLVGDHPVKRKAP